MAKNMKKCLLNFPTFFMLARQQKIRQQVAVEPVGSCSCIQSWIFSDVGRFVFAVKGSKIKPDPLANKNEKRRKFCAKYDGYGDFCEGNFQLFISCMLIFFVHCFSVFNCSAFTFDANHVLSKKKKKPKTPIFSKSAQSC